MENDEQRSGHGAKCKDSLREVGNTLLDDMVDYARGMALVSAGFRFVRRLPRYTKRIGMKRCLRNKAVRKGDAK